MWEVRVFTGTDARGRPTQISRTVRGGKRDAQRIAASLEVGPGSASAADRVLVEARSLATLRPAIDALASGVAPRTHFNNDTDREKRRVLDAVAGMPIQVFATICTKGHSTKEFQARACCVGEIVRQVQTRGDVGVLLMVHVVAGGAR